MKAAHIYSYGGSDKIKVEEAPLPPLTSREVLVKINDAGVNPVDWKIREGFLRLSHPQFPLTLGQDFSGEIVDIGPGVTGLFKGDRVFGFAPGSYAEYAAVPVERLALMPKTMDFETAAALPTAGLTAWQLVIDKAQIQENQNILIHGAAGGVGAFAVQIARWKNARVFATASGEDIPYLQSLGVQKTIDYKKDRFEEFFKDINVVLDLVGGDTLSRSYQIMKKGGLALSTVGSYSDAEALTYDVQGMNFVMNPDATELAELARLAELGVLKPRLGEVFPLTEAKKAQDLNQKGHSHGKVLLRMQ